MLACIVDAGSLQEYQAEYGHTLVTAFARIGGRPVGIVANQRQRCRTASGEMQIGGVLYADSAEKAARFVMDCNQTSLPIVFLQDVQGFMVGKQAEQSGIIRSGAKLVNVVSNSVVPKLTVIVGGSFGAGNYALCGKAYDPWLILAWPCRPLRRDGRRPGGRYAAAASYLRDAERRRQAALGRGETTAARGDPQRGTKSRPTSATGPPAAGSMRSSPRTKRGSWLATALGMIPEKSTWGEFRTGMLQM